MSTNFRLVTLLIFLSAVPVTLTAQEFDEYNLVLRPTRYEMDLRPDYSTGELYGSVRLSFTNTGITPTSTLPLMLYRLLKVSDLRDSEGNEIPIKQTVVAFEDFGKLQVNYVEANLPQSVAPGDTFTVDISYGGYLLGYIETGMSYVRDRIDPSFSIIRPDSRAYPEIGVPSLATLRRTGFAPSFTYRASITVPDSLQVAALGKLVDRTDGEGMATYVYESYGLSWRMDFAIARYAILEQAGHRVFHFPEDLDGGRRVMKNLSDCLNLFTDWFGPLLGDPRFTVIEIPDGWGSQTDITGIIQAAAAFKDPERSIEVYHEVSHLWNVTPTDPAPPRWNEGLASFLQWRAAEVLENEGSVEAEAQRILDASVEYFTSHPEYADVPMVRYGERDITGMSYRVGMVFFTILNEVLGQNTFNQIIGEYYRRYASSGGNTADFVALIKEESAQNSTKLLDEWLFSTTWFDLARDGMTVQAFLDRYW